MPSRRSPFSQSLRAGKPLARYQQKRRFAETPEPGAKSRAESAGHSFVVQKHDASRLHYDFRLELDGVLKSWAVTKGPSLDPADKRLAVHVEDHPLAYGTFEGTIPAGNYGAGTVMVWDRGTWEPEGDARRDFEAGRMKFALHGKHLKGSWALVRLGGRAQEKGRDNWLLIKHRDAFARPGEGNILIDHVTHSAISGKTMDELERTGGTWVSSRKARSAAAPTHADKHAAATRPRRRSKHQAMPDFVPPTVATLAAKPPAGEEWIHEIKIDGYRIFARREGGAVRLLTRTGEDWTRRFPSVARALAALPGGDFAIDGEIAVMDSRGRSSFAALQQALSEGDDSREAFIVFDLLFDDGADLRAVPLRERKERLKKLIPKDNGKIRYSDHVEGAGTKMFEHACHMALEGVVSKRADAPYRSGRGTDWVKSKCVSRQEFVIGGFTASKAGSGLVGALALGYYEEEQLRYAGRVGTGFGCELARTLWKRLQAMRTDQSPFAKLPAAARRGLQFVEPKLVCEVEFLSWTDDGMLRHPSFEGLREDKPAEDVTRDRPKASSALAAPAAAPVHRSGGSAELMGHAITHPDRVLFPDLGVTKRQLAEYYAALAPTMLPYIANRPLSLLRCPENVAECFFQKHFEHGMKALARVAIKEGANAGEYLVVKKAGDIVALVQEGIVEIHPWGSLADDPDKPDQVIFDLDPAPDVAWKRVVDFAHTMRAFLEELGLESFVKTTGGKGLHVIAPLRRGLAWETVKGFAHAVAQRFVESAPNSFIATASKRAREGKIFLDYLRNDRGSTAVAPYCVRARAGAPVAMPLRWDEVTKDLRPAAFSLATVPSYLEKRKQDPWAGMAKLRQTISAKARAALAIEET